MVFYLLIFMSLSVRFLTVDSMLSRNALICWHNQWQSVSFPTGNEDLPSACKYYIKPYQYWVCDTFCFSLFLYFFICFSLFL